MGLRVSFGDRQIENATPTTFTSEESIAHQAPHNVPSRGNMGPPAHKGSRPTAKSANFCMSRAPHFLGGPMPLSHASSQVSSPANMMLVCGNLASRSAFRNGPFTTRGTQHTFGLSGCRVKPRRPHQTGPPGLAHDSPRTPNEHISGPRRQTPPKFHEKTPKER